MTSHSALPTSATQRPVLLVVTPSGVAKQAGLDQSLKTIQTGLDAAIQIIQITDVSHPEVVRSFNFNALPAFVLLQQGQELWCHTGQIDTPEVFHQLYKQVETALLKNTNGTHL